MPTLLALPAELIYHISHYLTPPAAFSLLRTNRTLYHLLADVLIDSVSNDLTYASRAIYHAGERRNKGTIQRLVRAGVLKKIDFTLNAAVADESVLVICTLLDGGVPAHTQDDWGETPLIVAAMSGRVDIVRLLAPREDVNVNSTDWRRTTALAYAVRDIRDGVEIVRVLLERADTDVNVRDIDGRSALHHAVEFGGRESVEILLARPEVKVNFVDYVKHGMTALHRAVFMGDESIIRLLLDDPRVDVNLGDRTQHTPLHLAVKRGCETVLRTLLGCPRVDVNALNAAGCTPLAFAVNGSAREITGILISNPHVNVNLPDPKLQTPLCIAAKRARYSTAKLLLEREDLDVNSCCQDGMTPLAYAADMPFKERTRPECYAKVINLLGADRRVKANLADYRLETPLHKAVRAQEPKVVEELLRLRDIAVNARDRDGCTPLFLAVRMAEREEQEGAVRIVQALLADQHVDVNAQNIKGDTPLDAAMLHRQVGISSLLLAHEKIDRHSMGGKGLEPENSTRSAGDLPMRFSSVRRRRSSGGMEKKADVLGKEEMRGTEERADVLGKEEMRGTEERVDVLGKKEMKGVDKKGKKRETFLRPVRYFCRCIHGVLTKYTKRLSSTCCGFSN